MLISIIAVIVVFSIMILSHELGHFWMAKKMGVMVEVFSFGFGPKIKSFKRGGTEYALSLIPFGGYVKMAGDELSGKIEGKEWEFYSKPVYKRFNIIVAGSLMNYILGFLLFSLVFMLGSPIPTARVGRVLEGYPAEKAGIRADDLILSIDGKEVKYWEDVLAAIHNKEEGGIKVIVEREGNKHEFNVLGRLEDAKDILGKPIRKTMIGVAPSNEAVFVKYGFFRAIAMGGETVWKITMVTYQAIWGMIIGAVSVKAMAGPIGIFAMTGKAASMGIIHLLHISALISVSLAIFNLLPFPILDGGHILFLIIEKIKGRPVSAKAQEIAQNAAFVLLITFVLFISWNDILNLLD